jgi:uncharacterized membrane protein YgcG
MTVLRWLVLAGLVLASVSAGAAEEILQFASALQVNPDGSLAVSETIRVRAEGRQIRRGIYRDFPTDYRDRLGNRYRVDFTVVSVARDGRPEPYHTERLDNGVRVYAGQSDVYLAPGEYTYRIDYRTDRQLGFFADHDEFYWNVTGNGWDFPIGEASAAVTLPAGVPDADIATEAYTGYQGDHGTDYEAWTDGDGVARFRTTRPLRSHEGLTLVVSFPKGFVHEPTDAERATRLVRDNPQALIALGGTLLVLGYYIVIWLRVGRDPQGGPIVPLYEPPPNLSPAAARFLTRMGYDDQAFAAALVNLAVKGYLRIEQDAAKAFSMQRLGGTPAVAADEAAIASALFGDGRTEIALAQENHAVLRKALTAHRRALSRDYEKTYFFTNSSWLLPGILLGVVTTAATVLALPAGEQRALAGFMAVWLSFWSVGVFVLVREVIQRWRRGGIAGAIGMTLFAVPFVAGEVVGIGLLLGSGSWWVGVSLVGLVGTSLVFYQWLKAPTLAGRRLMDRVEGFKLYLGVAEGEELEFGHPPEKTPALFERYFPYALALGVELSWAEKFADVLARAQADGSHQPHWYMGSGGRSMDYGALAGALGGGFVGAISSSSTAPGSSSGSGGGGSSGGGGGGGGGGGW